MIKKIIVMLLTLALIGSYAISDINNAYAYTTSEENGKFTVDNFSYKILSENTVEIHGRGYYSNTNLEIPEYVEYNGITYSVTSIGKEAFRYSHLTGIIIPDSVTSIGEGAFRDCWWLTNITIPDSVTSIGPFAFHSCSDLMKIKIPNGVKEIERSTFGNCSSLMKVILPDGLTSIGYYAFKACTVLTDITIPDSVTYISSYAFTECKYLTNLKIPNSVINIGENAFYNCDDTFEPDGIVLRLLVEENSYALQYAKSNSIPHKLYNDKAKFVEGQLTYKVLSDNTVEVDNCDGTAIEVEIPEYVLHDGVNYKVTKIGSAAFYNHVNLQSVSIPNSITSIDGYAFNGCTSLTNISTLDSVTTIGEYAFNGCTSLTNISTLDSVTSIGDYAFYNCSSLANISMPDSVTRVGSYAFCGCESVTNIAISNSLTIIDECTFSGCSSLTSVTIPDGVKSIGIYAFSDCTNLTNITLPDSLTKIDYGVFNDCDNLEKIRIPSSVTYMNASMFSWDTIVLQVENDSYALQFALDNHIAYEIYTDNPRFVDGQLTYEVLSDTTVEVDKCDRKATEVEVPEYVLHNGIKYRVESIGNAAFYYCKDLKSVIMPNSVTNIKVWAYSDCSSLTNVTMPKGVTNIEEYAFNECSSLTNISIPDSVTSIENYAFKYCTSLAKVTIPGGVTGIDKDAFLWCYKIKLYVDLGSHALRYAIENSIPYVIIGNGSKPSYPDVKTTDWYYRSVEIATAAGLMGVENKATGSFSPNKNISRGMVATILYRMAGSPEVTYTNKFSDVKENIWYSNAIIWANKVGIVNGYQNGKFGPDDNITREQFAMMLYNYASKVAKISMYESANLSVFKDANRISSYAKPALAWAVGERIISGKDNGTKIAATDNATRAECAKMIVAFQDLIIAKRNQRS